MCPRRRILEDSSWLWISRRSCRTASRHETQRKPLRTPPESSQLMHHHGFLKDMGFTSTTSDPCVYTFGTSNTFIILTLCVDDLLRFEGITPVLKEVNRKRMERFTMADIGGVSLVLSMQITRDREAETLKICQDHCSNSILLRDLAWRDATRCTRRGQARSFSRSAGRYPAGSHEKGALSIHHLVPEVSEPVHTLRRRLRRQSIGPSQEQAIQATYDSRQELSAIPEGKHVPGTYVPDRLLRTHSLLRCELAK